MRGKGREGAGGGGGVGVECAYGERQWRGSWGEGSEGINNTFPEGRLAESCSERDGGTEGRKEGTKGGMGAPVRAGEGGGEGGPEIEKDLSFALVRLSPFTSLHFSVEAVVVCASGSHWPAGRRLARREPPDRRPTVPTVCRHSGPRQRRRGFARVLALRKQAAEKRRASKLCWPNDAGKRNPSYSVVTSIKAAAVVLLGAGLLLRSSLWPRW